MGLNDTYVNFLSVWNIWVSKLAIVFAVVGVLITLYYFLKLITISDPKKRHDFVNKNEINWFWNATLSLCLAAGLWLNTIAHDTVTEEVIWYFVRLFITASFTTIFGLIFNSLIRVYYPFYVEKRLNKLRHIPRKNPDNGNVMKLMSEEDEDQYLTPEMIEEEAIHSIDYDVWLDESTGYTKIEKYDGSSLAVECPSCGYRTLRVENEEVIKSATVDEKGELLNYYKCSYCGHKERRTIVTHKLAEAPKVKVQH